MTEAKNLGAPYELVVELHRTGKLPVPNFSAGGIATPADAALMRQLGAEAVFVGSGIFKSGDPKRRARAIVDACTHFDNPAMLAEVSADLGEADGRHQPQHTAQRRTDGKSRLVTTSSGSVGSALAEPDYQLMPQIAMPPLPMSPDPSSGRSRALY